MPLLFEETGTNVVGTLTAVRGDADAAFATRPTSAASASRCSASPPCRWSRAGLLAEWDEREQRMTVYGAAKVPFHNRRILAKQMGLPEDAITMIEADVGGGFGVRGEFYPEDFLIPFAATASAGR